MHLGEHSKIEASESLYDSLRRDWAMKFSSLTLESKIATLEVTGKVKSEVCKMGWALQKTRGSGTRFTEKVKEYLSSRFQTGERTGRKADPAQVAAEMRKAREADGARKFIRSEWLTKNQVQSYFSRLSAMKRRRAAKDQERRRRRRKSHRRKKAFKARDLKATLLKKLNDIVTERTCFQEI